MITNEITKIYDADYTITTINALKQYWRDTDTFECIGKPKKCNMLLFLDRCKAEYTLKNGEKYFAESGTIIYTPLNSEYIVKFFDFENEESNTVGVNFLLFNSDNNPFVISDKIEFFNVDNYNYKYLFDRLSNFSEANVICHSKLKSLLYDILYKISDFYHKDYNFRFKSISTGIEYLENDEKQLLSIKEIAEMCNVSEVYFRKLFKEYSGMSPIKYRITAKIFRAKNYLKYDDLTISEISYRLGFEEVSYFIKTFKMLTGTTPNQYRKRFTEL